MIKKKIRKIKLAAAASILGLLLVYGPVYAEVQTYDTTIVTEEEDETEYVADSDWFSLSIKDILLQLITPAAVSIGGYIYFCKNRSS